MSTVILLSGPVGAGKTTVSQALLAQWPRPLCYLEGDRFWDFAPQGGKPDSSPSDNARRKAAFPLVMRAMIATARSLARDGHEVLLDYAIPPRFLETARAIVKEVPLRYIVLLPDVETCAARAAARSPGTIHDYAGYRPFHALFAHATDHAIDNSDTEPETLAAWLCGALADGKFRVE